MDNTAIFRKKSLDRISSPEELGETLRVTSPGVWMILAAVILLLVGLIIWGTAASIDSYVTGTAQVEDGTMRILFDDSNFVKNVETGMKVVVGDTETHISSIGTGANGTIFAMAPTTLTNGSYEAKVIYKQTQIIRLLFN